MFLVAAQHLGTFARLQLAGANRGQAGLGDHHLAADVLRRDTSMAKQDGYKVSGDVDDDCGNHGAAGDERKDSNSPAPHTAITPCAHPPA